MCLYVYIYVVGIIFVARNVSFSSVMRFELYVLEHFYVRLDLGLTVFENICRFKVIFYFMDCCTTE